jgi:hypothetical protein
MFFPAAHVKKYVSYWLDIRPHPQPFYQGRGELFPLLVTTTRVYRQKKSRPFGRDLKLSQKKEM